MKQKLTLGGLILLAAIAGFLIGQPGNEQNQLLQQEINRLTKSGMKLSSRNQELEKTLDLVRLQVQTDRIAYDSLQQTVQKAEDDRLNMQQKLESQRELLERLKKKFDEL